MSATEARRGSSLDMNRLLVWLICLACAVVMVDTVFEVPELGAGGAMVDFDAFYIVGQMVWEGRLAEAYDPDVMRAMQKAASGTDTFMPWTYPPPFDLVTALFPFGSRGLSYALFISLTFVGYVFVLHRLAGIYLSAVLFAILPTLIITVRIGQNGFLTGALVGLFCLTMLRGRTLAGVPLGLMVIKPHLAIGLGVLVLVTRRWNVLLTGLAVVAAVSALATLCFGTDVWLAFKASVPEAKENLEKGLYTIYRMTSTFAAAFTLGAPAGLAMIAQVCVAVMALAAIVLASLKGMPLRQVLGLSCFATLAVSPYNYDYDMPILGLGLAVLAVDLMTRALLVERLALLGLSWLSCGWGLFVVSFYKQDGVPFGVQTDPSLAAFGHVFLFLLVWYILRRAPRIAVVA